MKETSAAKIKRVQAVIRRLKKTYPDAKCVLDYSNAWELLVATVLSAQCTDKRVNLVTPVLFKKYPRVKDYAEAELSELENLVRSTGFYRNKAKNIQGAARVILQKHQGQVPQTVEELTEIPGVGRKTANVILGNHFGIPALTVDTHMIRLNRLLGFSSSEDAVKVEYQLMDLVKKKDWVLYTHLIIQHGRARCIARRPQCAACEVQDLCSRVGIKI